VQWVGADEAARPVLTIRLGPALRTCDAAAAARFAEAVSAPQGLAAPVMACQCVPAVTGAPGLASRAGRESSSAEGGGPTRLPNMGCTDTLAARQVVAEVEAAVGVRLSNAPGRPEQLVVVLDCRGAPTLQARAARPPCRRGVCLGCAADGRAGLPQRARAAGARGAAACAGILQARCERRGPGGAPGPSPQLAAAGTPALLQVRASETHAPAALRMPWSPGRGSRQPVACACSARDPAWLLQAVHIPRMAEGVCAQGCISIPSCTAALAVMLEGQGNWQPYPTLRRWARWSASSRSSR
jgi:hypothetical protein